MPVVLSLQGCGANSLARDETLGWSADKLYAEAKEEMSAGNWAAAIKLLEKLESRYPFGRYAQQAQIDTAFATGKRAKTPWRLRQSIASPSFTQTMSALITSCT